jgi:NAD(P)H-nitrite reductase large subunit
MHYVITGNGIAAIGAVEGIRRLDRNNPITIISAEPYLAYGRPLIANLLRGKLSQGMMLLREESFYTKNGVNLLLGRKAVELNLKGQQVILDDGQRIPYDKLLLAMGGRPFMPPIKGLGQNYYTFTTLKDAFDLQKLPGSVETAVVIGGGLIGLKAAESLHDRGVSIHIVELADRILSTSFDETAGRIIYSRLKEVGMEIHLDTTVDEILGGPNAVLGVRLTNGEMVKCQGIVVAIGVVPEIELVAHTGINTNRGIVVDDYMETSVPGVYSAGDVAETTDMILREKRVTPIWPNAYRQGQMAGQNMAGAGKSYEGSLPMNSIAFYGIPTVSMGIANPPAEGEYETIIAVDKERGTYRKLVLRGDFLVGTVLVGKIERAGILTGMIKNRIPVSTFKDRLMKEDLGLTDLPREFRQQLLAVA